MTFRTPLEAWPITPYVGVGVLLLGMKTDEIEAALGEQSVPIDKGYPLPTASFEDLGVQAHFTEEGACEAFELFPPAQPVLNGQALLEGSFAEAIDLLRGEDQDLEIVVDMATSKLLGVGVYAPLAKETLDVPVESLIVFVRGYYDF